MVLLVSFIPDIVLPLPGRTLVSSSAAVVLHLVVGRVTVGFLFAVIYRRYLSPVYRYLLIRLGDPQEAEDFDGRIA